MIYLYKDNGVITVGEDTNVPITYYGRGGKSGKFYPTKSIEVVNEITIGNQTWTQSNLDVSTYRNGDIIPQAIDSSSWAVTEGRWAYYNFDSNYAQYGKLYNWYAVNDSRGLAPQGWHIPSNSEWDELISFLGGNSIAGNSMKEFGTNHWDIDNTATNSSGFTAFGGGFTDIIGISDAIKIFGVFQSSTAYDIGISYNYYLFSSNPTTYKDITDMGTGSSVRCIKDSPSSPQIFNQINNGFLINIGGDNYQVVWENLVIDGTSPTSFSEANTLLLNLFS